jgi:formamidopyrimidine-DNA glycosylase
VPELPEVEQVRRELAPYVERARIEDVELRRANLRTPFPADFRDRLIGQTVERLDRRGKYLLAALPSGDTLIMHLGMSGEFRVDIGGRAETDADKHDHVVFRFTPDVVVTFNDARRFGFMDVVRTADLPVHPALGPMGPEPLSDAFDAAALAQALRGRKTPIKVALLDQRVLAGIGNIYASEALHVARLSPLRRAGTLAKASGAPREATVRLAAAIRDVLTRAVRRQADPDYRGGRFRVYDRERQPCPRKGCGGVIRRRTQAGRSTFYCPVCQK